jgi:hemoglobin
VSAGTRQGRKTVLDPEASAHTQQSLYQRLGGYDVLAAFVHDLMPRLRQDPTLWVYWKGISDDSARRGDQLIIDFLCAAFGGQVHYAGRDMRMSHKGMGITEAEWTIFMPHIAAALDSVGVAPREKAEFLIIADGLKWDIVETSSSPAE